MTEVRGVRVRLSKWYADVVTDDGRAAIAYWGTLQAGRLHASVAGLLRSAGAAAASAFTVRAGSGPQLDGERLGWHAPALALHVVAERLAPAISHRLFEAPGGTVDWTAWAPAARVRIAVADATWAGAGYVERLDLTIAPWAVPVDTFTWGRWIGGTSSVVWITWRGPHPLRLAWHDGVAVRLDETGPDVVALGDSRLTLADHVLLTDAGVGAQLTSLRPLRALIGRVTRSHQTRWRSRGALELPGSPAQHGWAIHEVVRWR
jgi:hypothetical protein